MKKMNIKSLVLFAVFIIGLPIAFANNPCANLTTKLTNVTGKTLYYSTSGGSPTISVSNNRSVEIPYFYTPINYSKRFQGTLKLSPSYNQDNCSIYFIWGIKNNVCTLLGTPGSTCKNVEFNAKGSDNVWISVLPF